MVCVLRYSQPCSWGLLNAMATEAIDKDQVGDYRVSPNDCILIICIVVIETCPCTLQLEG